MSEQSGSGPTGLIRILLVEASHDDAKAFCGAFRRSSTPCEVIHCTTAEEALERLQDASPAFDVMVTAQRLPGMTGLDLCRDLLRHEPPCGLVLLTRVGSEQVAVDALKAGVHEYIIKDPDDHYLSLLPAVLPQVAARYWDDIARQRTERALRESEQRYQELYDHAPDMYFTVARDGTVLSTNGYGASALGYRKDELIGGSVWVVVHPDDRGRVQAQVEEIFAGGNGPNELDFRKVRKDGSVMRVHERVRYIPSRKGEPPQLQIVCRDVTERQRAEEAVLASRERLRNLAARLHAVREEERTVIAREIHDELGQALTGVKMDLSWIVNRMPAEGERLSERARATLNLVDATLESVRQISARLRPPMLDDLGLEAAIEWQAREFSARTGVECDLDLPAGKEPIHRDRATAVFRIFQEALTNVARHANAERVDVSLGLVDGTVLLEVRDDGCGIAGAELTSPQSLGVIGMRERAGALGGRVTVRAADAERGTIVTLELPLAEDAAQAIAFSAEEEHRT